MEAQTLPAPSMARPRAFTVPPRKRGLVVTVTLLVEGAASLLTARLKKTLVEDEAQQVVVLKTLFCPSIATP